MDWTSQTNELIKGWTEAQKQLMSSWMSMLPGAGGMGGMPGFQGFSGFPGAQGFAGFPGFQGMQGFPGFDPSQWMKMAVDTWSGMSGGGTSDRVAGNLFGAPDVMVRSVNLMMKAFQAVAPKIEAGEDWQPDLQGLISKWQQEMTEAPQRQMATMNEFGDLTKSLFEQWSPMTGPWMAMMTQALSSGHPGAAFMGGTNSLGNMMGMEEGLMPIMSGLGELPRGTVVREKMGTMLKAVDAMTDLRKAQADYHKAMGDAMGKAVERTVEHLAKLAEKGEAIDSVRDLMRTWFTVADQTLNEVFISPEFLKVQDDMTNALMTFKVRKRAALDIIYESMEIPTRAEIDEAYKDIHLLKREIRALKRQLKEVTAEKKPARAPARAAKSAPAA